MRRWILFIILTCISGSIYSQKQFGQYLFDEPVYGTIYYKKGAVIKGILNYNMLIDDMELFTEDGKRTKIENFAEIEYIGLGLIKFVPISNYYTEIIFDGENIILGKLHLLEIKKESGAKAISKRKLNSILDKEGELPEGITLEKKYEHYIKKVEEPNTSMFYLAKSKEEKATSFNFIKLFSKYSKEINNFIKENKTEFSNEANLLELCKFCDKLVE